MISKDEWKVAHVMRRTCCTRETAVDYLDAEEWDEADAVISLDGDRDAVLKEHWQNMLRPSYRRHQAILENEGAR